MEYYHKEKNCKTYNFPMITNAPFDNTNVDFYRSLKSSIFHLFSMYWYCKDHQTCPSSYESWQDLFNSNKKGITFSLKNSKINQNFHKSPELSKKNPIVQGVRIYSWILQKKLPIIISIISIIK